MRRYRKMMKKWAGKLAALSMMAALSLPFAAAANTYYLSPSGDDSNDGMSEANAFKTVNKAFSAVHSESSASKDELIILPGTYAATGLLSMSGQDRTDLAEADVIRSSTRNPADVVIYGDGTFNLLNMARCVIVEGITFSNGVATASGVAGGVRVGSNTTTCPTVLTNCVITCCRADVGGKAAGGAYVHGGGIVTDCVIENCSAKTDGGAAGVFLNNSDKTPTIEHTVIRNCSGTNISDNATCAGGVASGGSKGGSERIVDCVISNCTTTVKGGGAYFDFAQNALVSATTFAQCRALRGGGVLVMNGTGAFENCDFTTNTADDGGAFYLMGNASVSMTNCTFTANQGGFGGAATFDQSSNGYFAFTNCVFASNTATNNGGAVSCARMNFPNGKDNSDASKIKGMYGEFYSCTFTNNVARESGGALFLRDSKKDRNSGTPLVLRNSLFAYNQVSTAGHYHCGGGIYLLSYDTPVVDSCTIVCNNIVVDGESTQFGAGFYTRWNSSIVNTIIAHNTMSGNPEGRNDWIRSAGATVSYSCAYPAPKQGTDTNPFTDGNHCISADPKFADAANGDFTLKNRSLCKDAGLLEDWMDGAFDLAGNVRVFRDVPDIGCYERCIIRGMAVSIR